MPVNRPEEHASTHYYCLNSNQTFIKNYRSKRYMFCVVKHGSSMLLLLRMTYKLKCFINFIVHMAIARTLIHTMSIQYRYDVGKVEYEKQCFNIRLPLVKTPGWRVETLSCECSLIMLCVYLNITRAKSRYYKERNVQSKKRKAIRR